MNKGYGYKSGMTGCGHLDEAVYVENSEAGRRLKISGWFLFPEPWTVLQFSPDGKRFYVAHRIAREDIEKQASDVSHAKESGYVLDMPIENPAKQETTIVFRALLANGLTHAGTIHTQVTRVVTE